MKRIVSLSAVLAIAAGQALVALAEPTVDFGKKW